MNNVYRFVGILNVFRVYPDFSLPVYEKDGNLYVQEGERGIGTGMLILDEDLASRVLYFDLKTDGEALEPAGIKDIEEGTSFDPIFCFQENANQMIIGSAMALHRFFDDYQPTSIRVREEISVFRKDNPRKALREANRQAYLAPGSTVWYETANGEGKKNSSGSSTSREFSDIPIEQYNPSSGTTKKPGR